jgi:hypothetical protein
MPESPTVASPTDTIADTSPGTLASTIEGKIREELRRQLETERKLLTDAVGLAIKIVITAFGVLLTIFTVFGLTTWKDIKAETASIVSKQATELLEKANSETGVKEQLNDLLNRTLVVSTLVARARTPDANVELSRNDWDRLRRWIQNENLPLQDFSDVLAVLNAQSDDRKKADANRLLAELLNPPEQSAYRWIRKQPEKIDAILAIFKHQDMGSTAIDVLESKLISVKTRGAAADYVLEVGFSDGVERLLAVHDGASDGTIRRRSLVAATALQPNSPVVLSRVKKISEDQSDPERVATALQILGLIYPSSNPSTTRATAQDFDALKTTSHTLFAFAASRGLTVRATVPDSSFGPRSDRLFPTTASRPVAPVLQFWFPTSKSSSRSVLRMTVDQFEEFEPYWVYLSDRANIGAVNDFRAMLPRPGFTRSLLASSQLQDSFIAVTAAPDAQISLAEKGVAPGEFMVANLNNLRVPLLQSERSENVQVSWDDVHGEVHSAVLSGFRGNNFKFQLRSVEARAAQ